MWPSRETDRLRILDTLRRHDHNVQAMPGISAPNAAETLALQMVASLRREDYYSKLNKRPIDAFRADPRDPRFDPERAVVFHRRAGSLEEAIWLVFLMTHFAKPAESGWRRLREFYGMLGHGLWDWSTTHKAPNSVDAWLLANWDKIGGKFGNHRKYESLRPGAKRYTGDVIREYVAWAGPAGQGARLAHLVKQGGNDPFDAIYRSLKIGSFGRLGRFDYLMHLSRYGLAPIRPTSAYLTGATGPRGGVSLLFTGTPKGGLTAKQLQTKLSALDDDLGVGMSVLEDSLCNWQKSPMKFVHFRG